MIEFQKQFCLKMLDKIEAHPLSELFREPAEPGDERYAGYLDKSKKPMDLSTVRKKLNENQYKCIGECHNDIRLIWSNAISSYPESSNIYKMASDMSNIFEKKWGDYPRTKEEWWYQKLKKVQKSVKYLHDNFPIMKSLLPEKTEEPQPVDK